MAMLENEQIRIGFSEANGAIVELVDKRKQISYVKVDQPTDPFRLERGMAFDSHFTEFRYRRNEAVTDGDGYVLIWKVTPLVEIIASVSLACDSAEVIFTSEVVNHSDESITAIEYPIISNLSTITPHGDADYLAHSFATGFEIRNPMSAFQSHGEGLRFAPYPEGFSGATMQFFTYYGLDLGGLYFAAYDGNHFCKWLNFYKNGDGLEASFIHGYEDVGAQKGIVQRYPVVLKLMTEGNWYEAADEYKQWAVKQTWTKKGRLTDRADAEKATWLLEDIGLTTFGINAGADRTKWIEAYHRLADTNVFHITGPDWPNAGQTYTNRLPGGMEDWFPSKFNQNNIATFKTIGDKFAPFEFDYLFNFHGADSELGQAARHLIPTPPKSVDRYRFSFVCPVAPYVQELHVERDRQLAREIDADAIYYDISANNILKVCMDPTHGHPVGAGSQVTEAYWNNYAHTKQAMCEEAGRYIPMGTEMICEVFLDVLDFYQARAGAQPATDFEGWNLRELLKTRDAQLIPMFTYVYHEYAPVRLDGWGRLNQEIGRLFYFTVARTYLWGGLYELNYEYSPMEVIDGLENPAEEHYYPFAPRGYELAAERGEYLRQFAHLRTGRGNKYLAYGTMLRPLRFTCATITLDWFHYNSSTKTPSYNDQGEVSVESIVHSAWAFKDESLGMFFANVAGQAQTLDLVVDMSKYQLAASEFVIEMFDPSNASSRQLAEIGAKDQVRLEVPVPSMTVVLLEIRPL